MRYHLKSSVGKDEDLQYFYTLLSQATILENNFFYYPVKLSIDKPYNPVISPVSVYPREILYICKGRCVGEY